MSDEFGNRYYDEFDDGIGAHGVGKEWIMIIDDKVFFFKKGEKKPYRIVRVKSKKVEVLYG